ncbi:4-amino-4-deoxychorismate lyase [Rhodococcus sp. PvR044]|jgi:4-amino-4-deoxychorismate lyase|uniref:aminodeoxychorismate lyase n=1 Tax=Rhodococcus TaxID=1827 RepID=UPI000BCAD7D8|nr:MULTISPECIES: aminodeoxychorismate lyase [Rhodococcus]MBP1160596.1 4-amino-4-deoxychorismate lyase [Rhodococcus sp. PvR099]MCZ4556343.1 aminodeoxychorismate lyase [Rhodococcus maanshanensis]PTR43093.1 4-amino-4-deoxychorismate lyase [Rhodococcus sp. OK611]SNX91428.1 4-amino-4-deoxychorismate lyase [Rhodococcus sp. OK270]
MAPRVLVTLDGKVHDPDVPLLYADDLAAVRGDGVFETVLVRGGSPCTIELHLERLNNSAAAIDLPEQDLDRWRAAVKTALAEWDGDGEGLMRLVLSRGREIGGGPTGYLTLGPIDDRVAAVRRDGIAVVTLPRGFSVDLAALAPWQLLGAKTLSYATNMAALRHANSLGADDVIFTSSEGLVLEGPRSTVVIARGRTLITPPIEQGILPGTTQRALFEIAGEHEFRTEVAPLRPADLILADGVWLLSSVTLAARVRALNGRVTTVPEIAEELSALVDLSAETVGAMPDAV